MSANVTNPGKDGCGPYGRHLTGVTSWQKYYGLSDSGWDVLQFVASTDYLTPIPPPSQNINIDGIAYRITNAGHADSLVRVAIYDMETFPAGTLVVAAAEITGSSAGLIVQAMTASTLRANGRYAALFAASGTTLPKLSASIAAYSNRSWLGTNGAVSPDEAIGSLTFTRVYGAFPATYNGAYASILRTKVGASLRLP